MTTTEESVASDLKNCEIDSKKLTELNNNEIPEIVNEKCLISEEKKIEKEETKCDLEKDDYLSSSNDSLNFVKVVHNARSFDEPKNLTETLEDARWMMKEFLNGKFQLIMERCKKRSHVSFFHEAGSAIFDFLDAFLAFEKDKFSLALVSMRKASERANSYRKKTGIVGYLVRGDFSQHTDLELHAELMFAVTELMTGLLQMLADQSIYGAINACIKAKTAYSALKNCEYALQDKVEWESELSKQNLESGTCLGIGAFDLILSFCPSTITRILDYVGFNSDRLNALDLLQRSIDQEEAIYYEVCTVVKIAYHAFLSYFYGIGELNKSFFKRCTQKWTTSQTNAEFLSVCKGSRDLVHGRPISAIKYFKQCLVNQTAYPQLNYICYWQMTWAYVMQCDWEEAVHYTGLLKDKCNWSRAMFTYLHAIFLYQHMEKNKVAGLEPKISETLCMVPKLKRNLGGKKAFHEKIVLDRSKKYNNKINEMLLPALELIYIWNVFNMMSNDPKLLENYLELIEEKLKIYVKTPERTPLDKHCYLIFMKGVILRHLNKTDAAIDHFNQVLSCKPRIFEQHNLLPQSCFELGMINLENGKLKESKKWLKKAKNDYYGYVTQTLIEYRVRWTLDIIKQKKKLSEKS